MRRLVLVPLLAGSLFAPAFAASEPGTIVVRGTGVVRVVPDVADIEIGVVNEGAAPAEVIDRNSDALKRVVDEARRAGVEERDVQTSFLDLGQSRDGKGAVRYRAVNVVRVRIRDLARLGAVTRGLLGAGANDMRGIRFSTADPAPYLDTARQQAVEDARRRAEVLAAAAGRRLGDISEIAETTLDDPGIVAMGRAAQRADIPTEPGELALRAGVEIKWRLGP